MNTQPTDRQRAELHAKDDRDSMTNTTTATHPKECPMNVEATTQAIALLDQARLDAAPLPTAVWRILAHASDRLNTQLAVYFNPEKAKV